jgi:hypothetical protein
LVTTRQKARQQNYEWDLVTTRQKARQHQHPHEVVLPWLVLVVPAL